MGRAKKMWVQEAFSKHKGALHKALHVPKGQPIPEKKLERAEHSRSPLMRKRASLAARARNFHHGDR